MPACAGMTTLEGWFSSRFVCLITYPAGARSGAGRIC
jgi:hypothetical protein